MPVANSVLVDISIHAPPRGATSAFVVSRYLNRISIHAPPRGATSGTIGINPPLCDFNSRPSARGDRAASRAASGQQISIHAPPRGATAARRRGSHKPRISIHAPPRGATGIACVAVAFFLFQFTPLREGRRSTYAALCALGYISIHAPPRGATQGILSAITRSRYFNSRPSARGDQKLIKSFLLLKISIHAPPRGATTESSQRTTCRSISIHAPPRGATRRCDERLEAHPISIHAPPRGATSCVENVPKLK